MHASSLENMQWCFDAYVKKNSWPEERKVSVIDIGGANVNGSYADVFSGSEFDYKAVDIESSESVDIVLSDPYELPFEDASVDIIISGQAFEHVEFFWVLFEEMVRVLSNKGILILIAPSAGPIHRYPVDCYRFYPDAYSALANYTNVHLLNVKHDDRGPWKDLVGVFTKSDLNFSHSDRVWEKNRFEIETCPTIQHERSSDESHEVINGEVSYLSILNEVHKLKKPQFYLEIGVRKGNSLSLAHCEAFGIDPIPEVEALSREDHELFRMTSDHFFDDYSKKLSNKKLDLCFIDGMHLFEFVLRDFINIEMHSSVNSLVVVDDVFPNHEIQASRKRCSQVWTGDVWKFAEILVKYRSDLRVAFLDTSPTGLLLISGLNKNNRSLIERYNPIVREFKEKVLEGEFYNKYVCRNGAINPESTSIDAVLDSIQNAK